MRALGDDVGVAIDVYHLWWDPELDAQIARAGAKRILAHHICDWLVPTKECSLDRGMTGDGVIDLAGDPPHGRGGRLSGAPGGRDFFGQGLVEAPGRRSPRTCVARFESICQA